MPLCRLLVLLAALSACCLAACDRGAGGPGALALENVTLIDGTGAPSRTGATVIVRDGRIEAVGESLRIARGTDRHDLTGKYLIPGLIDMHAHIAIGPVESRERDGVPAMSMTYDEAVARHYARELLRWGVTTARNPAGPTAEAVALRDALNAGELTGPRLFTAGSVLDQTEFEGLNAPVHTPEEVAEEVAHQAAAGVDMIKLYASLTPPLVEAGIEAAHSHGLPAIGHLWLTDWRQAIDFGIDGIVHALPMSHTLLPPERAAEYMSVVREALAGGTGGTQAMYLWFEYADLDHERMRAVYAEMAAHGVHHDPTLVAIESMFFAADGERIRGNADLDTVPQVILDNWRGGFSLTAGWTDDDYRRAQEVFPRALELTRRMHEAGVRLTAGSDLSMPWLAPGTSLHRELELLHAAGIPAPEVIAIATRNAAEALGRLDEFGTVEPGKRADLVVLDADPLTDVGNTRRIARVFQAGVEVNRD